MKPKLLDTSGDNDALLVDENTVLLLEPWDSTFTDQYVDKLLIQYSDKPNATAEIRMLSYFAEELRDFLASFPDEYGIDEAVGVQLDVLGKRVGLARPVGMNDGDYRFLLRIKIARNNGSSILIQETGDGLQDVIQFAFSGDAYVIDTLSMVLTLYVSPNIDLNLLATAFDLDLLPKPQGVPYNVVVQADPNTTFGFDINVNAQGFASKFDSDYEGGRFARKVYI